MFRLDMHTHTSHFSPCGHQTIGELLSAAAERGLHVVCVTEHHYRWPDDALQQAAAEAGVADKLVVLGGEEISCYGPDGVRQGDYLVYGLPASIGAKMDVHELIQLVHGHGGIVVAAHPFREGYGSDKIVASLPVDALEVYNKAHTFEQQVRAWKCAERSGILPVGNSDAHAPEEVGRYVTFAQEPVRSLADFIRQVRERKVWVPAPTRQAATTRA
ncbi:MAG: PHP domain-containing protein [Armatimonadetes bacterium]|nr:PHP domain-containing protein [Armatimonadota bacterium]